MSEERLESLSLILQDRGLGEFEELLRKQKVFNDECLPTLTDADLKEIGVELLGDRRGILEAVKSVYGDPELLASVASDIEAAPQPGIAVEEQVKKVKEGSRLVAFLLWFFLGTIGAHRYYLKKVGTGILQLVLLLCSFIPLLGYVTAFILGIWLLVDLIRILTGGLLPTREVVETHLVNSTASGSTSDTTISGVVVNDIDDKPSASSRPAAAVKSLDSRKMNPFIVNVPMGIILMVVTLALDMFLVYNNTYSIVRIPFNLYYVTLSLGIITSIFGGALFGAIAVVGMNFTYPLMNYIIHGWWYVDYVWFAGSAILQVVFYGLIISLILYARKKDASKGEALDIVDILLVLATTYVCDVVNRLLFDLYYNFLVDHYFDLKYIKLDIMGNIDLYFFPKGLYIAGITLVLFLLVSFICKACNSKKQPEAAVAAEAPAVAAAPVDPSSVEAAPVEMADAEAVEVEASPVEASSEE